MQERDVNMEQNGQRHMAQDFGDDDVTAPLSLRDGEDGGDDMWKSLNMDCDGDGGSTSFSAKKKKKRMRLFSEDRPDESGWQRKRTSSESTF